MLEYVLVHKDETQKTTKSKDMWEQCAPVSWLYRQEHDRYVVASDLHGALVELLV